MSEERKEKLTREQLIKIMEDTLMLYKYLDQKGEERDFHSEQYKLWTNKKPPKAPVNTADYDYLPPKPSYPKKPKLGCLWGIIIVITYIFIVFSSCSTDIQRNPTTALSVFYAWAILSCIIFLIGVTIRNAKYRRTCQLIDLEYEDRLDRIKEENEEAEIEYQAEIAQYEELMKKWDANEEGRKHSIEYYSAMVTKVAGEMREVEEKIALYYQIIGLPTTYYEREIFTRLYGYFFNNRVDTIREAINLYETEKRQQELEDSLAWEIEKLKYQIEDGQKENYAIQRQLAQAQENAAALTSDQMNAIKEKLNHLNSSAAILEYYAANSSNK